MALQTMSKKRMAEFVRLSMMAVGFQIICLLGRVCSVCTTNGCIPEATG